MSKTKQVAIEQLKHAPLRNYVTLGLTSWVLARNPKGGCVRMFESDRHLLDTMSPHSHRYDFSCQVLEGYVLNRIWLEHAGPEATGDLMQPSLVRGSLGDYYRTVLAVRRYVWVEQRYEAGDWYAMRSHEIHTILFSRGARVLFFEGPERRDDSVVLEPVDHHTQRLVPTLVKEPWMFLKEEQ